MRSITGTGPRGRGRLARGVDPDGCLHVIPLRGRGARAPGIPAASTILQLLLTLLLTTALHSAEEQPYMPVVSGEVLHANTVEFWMLSFRDVVTRPELHGRKLVFDRSQGKAYGGMVYGWLAVDLPDPEDTNRNEPVTYRAHFDVAHVDLATLLRQLGGNAQNLSGEVAGWIDLNLLSDHPEAMTGRGELTIRKGSLVQLPVLANLLVGDPGANRGQDKLDMRFELGEGRINLMFARLDSPAAKLEINGSIGFDGELRLQIEPTFTNRLTNALTGGIAELLLNPLTRRAARLSVRGQITHPVLVSDPFGRSKD